MDIYYARQRIKDLQDNLVVLQEILAAENSLDAAMILDGKCSAFFAESYSILNTLWNARSIPQEEIDQADRNKMSELVEYPRDLEWMVRGDWINED